MTEKRRPGNPGKPDDERGRRVNVYLPPDVLALLDAMEGTRSGNIARLVREARPS